MYTLGDTVTANYMFYDATTEAPATGYLEADLQNVSLMLNGTTDKTSLLSMAEVGVTGEYVISFTPDAAGHYSLIFTEPVGTFAYNQRATWEVYPTGTTIGAGTVLYDMVVSHLQDDAGILATGDLNEAVNSAILNVYSQLNPYERLYTYTGDGSAQRIYLSVLTYWNDGFSTVNSIEYPLASNPPTYLNRSTDWWYGHDATGKYVGINVVIASAVEAYLIYNGVHDADGTSLSDIGKRQVSFLAAGFALEKIAAYYLQHKNSLMGDASVEYDSRSDQAARRAKEYMALFYSFFGGDGKSLSAGIGPAFVRVPVDLQTDSNRPVSSRLTHGY